MSAPTLDSIKALHGLNFAMLNSDELACLNFYLEQGRKYDVAVSIISNADPVDLAKAPSKLQAHEIMRRANSVVSVNVGPAAQFAWMERAKP